MNRIPVNLLDNDFVADVAEAKYNAQEALDIAQGFVVPEYFIGNWNADTNTPTLTTVADAPNGHYYYVSVAGTKNITGVSEPFNINDRVVSNGTTWSRLPYGVTLPDESVSYQKLALNVKDLIPNTHSNPDYPYVIADLAKKIAAAILPNGKFRAKLDFSLSPIELEDLSLFVQGLLPKTFQDSELNEWAGVFIDSVGKIALGINRKGEIVGKVKLADQSVTESMLESGLLAKLPTTEFLRINAPNQNDFEYGKDDELWRGVEFQIPTKTSSNGYFFERLPNIETRTLEGLNTTGTSIQIRETCGIVIRGKKYIADFNPSTDGSLNGLLYSPGDFWNVTASGAFLDLTLSSGDRLIYIGYQSNYGTNYPMFIKQRTGEFFCMGEVNPSSFSPTSPRNYDFYIVSADGTYNGVAYAVGDYVAYKGGWGKIAGNVKTIANNEFFSLKSQNANEYSVRRTDKSNTVVSLLANGYRTALKRRVSNNLVLYSDSMFGIKVGASIQALLTTRTATTESFGSGRSIDVLTMIQKRIRQSDIYAGRLHCFWHGQNNNTDLVQIQNTSLQMAALASTHQSRFVFWSMVGQQISTWNGTRIVQANHEDAFAGAGRFVELEQWYEAIFPSKWFSPRIALLESAVGRTRKHLQFPGLTEAQAASTYGVLPLSYFFDFSAVAWNPDTLNFLGYQSTSGLPTGGSNNDYYIRSGGGTVGNIIVNVSGTWIEYSYDTTHLNDEGANAVAQKFINFLTLKNY